MYRYISRSSFRFVVLLALVGALTGIFLKYSGTASSQRAVKPLPVVIQKTAPAPVVQTRPTLSKILAPLADGDLDTTFHSADTSVPPGVARVFFNADPTTSNDTATGIGVQTIGANAGKVVLGGDARGAAFNFALSRFNTNGTLDDGGVNDTVPGDHFGTAGKTITTFGGQQNQANVADTGNNIAIDPVDDKIVLVGSTTNTALSPGSGCASADDIAVSKYTADGVLDATFSGGGQLKIDLSPLCKDYATAVIIQADQKIVVLAITQTGGATPTSSLALIRLKPDGSFDTTLNGTGFIKIPFVFNGFGLGYAIRQITSGAQVGKYIVVGQGDTTAGGGDFFVARFNSDGSLDNNGVTGFGPTHTGFVNTDFGVAGPGNDTGKAVAIQPDGKIVAAGDVNLADFAVARYNSDGSLDGSFGTGGKVITDLGTATTDGGYAVNVVSNGKIVVMGKTQTAGGPFGTVNCVGIVRYLPNGTLDGTFGTGGKVRNHLGANPNIGNTDNSQIVQTGMIGPDGKILVAGEINTPFGNDPDFFVAKFNNFFLTAAGVSVSGRVTTADGQGLRNAAVVLTDSHGVSRTVLTGAFGTYTFDDVQTGDTYIIGVASKHYRFGSRVLVVTDTASGQDFVADE